MTPTSYVILWLIVGFIGSIIACLFDDSGDGGINLTYGEVAFSLTLGALLGPLSWIVAITEVCTNWKLLQKKIIK